MINIPEKYRLKALACEGFARNATDQATRDAWIEIAIEWHALAYRTAQQTAVGVEAGQGSPSSLKPVSSAVATA